MYSRALHNKLTVYYSLMGCRLAKKQTNKTDFQRQKGSQPFHRYRKIRAHDCSVFSPPCTTHISHSNTLISRRQSAGKSRGLSPAQHLLLEPTANTRTHRHRDTHELAHKKTAIVTFLTTDIVLKTRNNYQHHNCCLIPSADQRINLRPAEEQLVQDHIRKPVESCRCTSASLPASSRKWRSVVATVTPLCRNSVGWLRRLVVSDTRDAI